MSKPRTRAPAKRTARKGDGTRQRILDAAERLFADNGYEATGIREITAAANVQIGQLLHHFGTKDGVLREVILRRAGAHVANIRSHLETARRRNAPRPPRPRDIVEAMVQVVVDGLSGNATARAYLRLAALCMISPKLRGLMEIYVEQFDRLNEEYITELRKACPSADPGQLRLAYFFMESLLIDIIVDVNTLYRRTRGALAPDDIKKFKDDLIDYMTAGFERVVEREPRP